MEWTLRWLWAFVFTELVETGIYVRALGERPMRERLAIALGASAITHPIVWFVLPDVGQALGLGAFSWPTIALSETFAFVVEAAWLAAFGVRRAPLWSLAANLTSFGLGLIGYTYFGW